VKIVETKKIKLSTGVELWITEMADGRVRMYHAGSTKKKKKTKDTRKVEVSALTPIAIDLIFSGS
jgi:hypothetical protein